MFKRCSAHVYMMASKNRKALYIGVTNDLYRRVLEHKSNLIEGFTKKYHCHSLVYFEEFNRMTDAIDREKQLKRWCRSKKDWLIKQLNPYWNDLSDHG